MKKLILWGATGQSIMLEEILSAKYQLIALFDNNSKVKSPFPNTPIFHGEKEFNQWKVNVDVTAINFMIAIGGENGKIRVENHQRLINEGLRPISAIHKSAYLSSSSSIGEGAQILPNATICSRVKTGLSVIINTSASVDHECILGNGVHIAPGATLAGCVKIGDFSFIGANATILPNIIIGENTIIGAGSVVTKDIPSNTIAYGNPCKIILNNNKS